MQGFEIHNFTSDGIETAEDWTVRDNTIHDTNVGLRLKASRAPMRSATC